MNTFDGFSGDFENTDEVLKEHSTDASVFRVKPTAVLYPKSREDIALVVRKIGEMKKRGEDVSVSVRAGGTCMSGGSLHTGYMLNLTRYMNAIRVDPVARTVTVEMGAYFRDIEAEALKHGLMFAPYPSSKMICGIGGMVGNNASGEKSLRHGATIDNVISLEVVGADGEVFTTGEMSRGNTMSPKEKDIEHLALEFGPRLKDFLSAVPKTSSGYRLDRVVEKDTMDLTPLFVGAQGTLGIITKAVLHLTPIPVHSRLLLVSIDSLQVLPSVLRTVLTHDPECVETFDINTFKRARQHLSEDASRIEFCFRDDTHALVLVELSEETDEETERVARLCFADLEKLGVRVHFADNKDIFDSAWNVRRHSFSLMWDNNEEGFRAVPCIEDSIVPVAVFDVFVTKLLEIIARYNISYAYHGHIGEGALRVIPLFDMRKSDVGETIISFTREVVALLLSLRGNPSADHSDGIIRSPFLKEFYGDDMYDVFTTIKEIFDPLHILNPYKKTGGTESNILKWLDR